MDENLGASPRWRNAGSGQPALIAFQYRPAEWRQREVEPAAHELLQLLDRTSA